MRKFLGLLLTVLVAGCLFLPDVQAKLPQLVAYSQTTAIQAVKKMGVQFPIVGRKEKARATPAEAIVQPRALHRKYYYHYDDNVSPKVQAIFDQAVAVYNETGIVDLVEGTPAIRDNGIKIFTYAKRMPANQTDYLELGKGGPTIQKLTGLNGYTINRAQAGFNLKYPQSIKLSVAIHELGHALGLDHSESSRSVMYPIDQGHTRLATGDLKTLRYLYQEN